MRGNFTIKLFSYDEIITGYKFALHRSRNAGLQHCFMCANYELAIYKQVFATVLELYITFAAMLRVQTLI